MSFEIEVNGKARWKNHGSLWEACKVARFVRAASKDGTTVVVVGSGTGAVINIPCGHADHVGCMDCTVSK